MTCYHPNDAYISGVRSSGTKIISFGLPKLPDQETFTLPCGQCIGCRLDRANMWAVRMMHEAQMHDDNCMITLTYNQENYPQYGSLVKHHPQNFLKRLRKHTGKIKYYLGAEYGDQLKRPHYHICIFGHDFADKECISNVEGMPVYESPLLEKIWGKGFCTISDLTIETAAYVARYCMKKVSTAKNSEDKHYAHYQTICATTGEIRQIEPEYSTMSRGGRSGKGIASDWYAKYHSDLFPHDTTIYKGRNVKTPRYYENLLRSTDLPTFEAIKEKRKEQALVHQANNTPARLAVREKVKKAQISQLKRTYENEA